MVVNQELPFLKLVEAGNEFAEAGFARSCVPDQGHCLAGLDRQIKVVKDRLALFIMKRDVSKFDFSPHLLNWLLVSLAYFRLGIQQCKNSLAGRQADLELTPEGSDTGERNPEQAQALNEKKPVAGCNAVVEYGQSTEVEYNGQAQVADEREYRQNSLIEEI